MHSRTCMSVVVCVVRKLRPCNSYSRRRDRINSVLWRRYYKGGGGTLCRCSRNWGGEGTCTIRLFSDVGIFTSEEIVHLWALTCNNFGCLFVFRDQLNEAFRYFTKSLKLVPNSASTLLNYSVVSLRLGRQTQSWDASLEAVRRVAQETAQNAPDLDDVRKVVAVYHQLGMCPAFAEAYGGGRG